VSDPNLFEFRPARARHDCDVATVALEKLGNSLAKIFHRTLVGTLLRGALRLRIFGVPRLAALSIIEAESAMPER
jgi:hypothetical protein